LDILNGNPSEPFPVGAQLSAGYEFEVENYVPSDLGLSVFVPVIDVLFPTAAATSVSVTIPALSSSIAGPSWSVESSGSFTAGVSLSFANRSAQLVTAGYTTGFPYSDAVQAAAPYGTLTLEFRWQWTLTPPTGPVTVGPWTVPSSTASDPALPSIFEPAPEVVSVGHTGAVLSMGTNILPGSVAMGTTFTDALTGFVVNTTLGLSYQNATGVVLGTSQFRTPVSGAGPFAASIPVTSASGALLPGPYIFHVQDHCGAVVQDLGFNVTYPTSAVIQVGVSPASCGAVVSLNGIGYPNHATVTDRPSPALVPLSAEACPSYSFVGWRSSGGVLLASPTSAQTSLLESWSGTLTAVYGIAGAVTFTETGLATGALWNVTLDGATRTGTAPSAIVFSEAPGTYAYVIGSDAPGLATPPSGTVTFSGTPVSVAISFSPPVIKHVVLILMENQDLNNVLSYAPYMDYLWNTYGRVAQFYPACHPSLSDYAALTSGRTYNCGANITESTAANLPDVLQSSGLTWGGYFESMPSPCDRSWLGTIYDPLHDPFFISRDIVNNASRCNSHIVNSAVFNESVANGTLPSFSLYIPNTQDDCEYSPLPVCGPWLQNFLPPMLNSTVPAVQQLMSQTAFFIVFDEGLTYQGYSVGGITNSYCANETGMALTVCGGHTYAVVVSPYSLHAVYSADATDYGVLTTIEWLLGVGNDGGYDGTANFPAMTSLFQPT
jgi:hypothetical protein